jgi:hypothetical protein
MGRSENKIEEYNGKGVCNGRQQEAEPWLFEELSSIS